MVLHPTALFTTFWGMLFLEQAILSMFNIHDKIITRLY